MLYIWKLVAYLILFHVRNLQTFIRNNID